MSQRVVFDTNMLVSAAILPRSVPAKAYQHVRQTGEIAVSDATLTELFDVLQRPKFDKYISLEKRLLFHAELVDIAFDIPVTHTVTDCRDPKDNKFLELALSASATAIITGDADLLVLHPFENISILTPADFIG